MTSIDVAKAVLAKASLYDQSFANPDLGILRAWAKVLEDTEADTDMPAALAAVDIHYGRETRRIMPADISRNITEARRRVALERHDERVWRELEAAREAHDPKQSHAGYLEASRLLVPSRRLR